MALIWKRAIFDLLTQFLLTREKTQKFLSTYLTHFIRILLALLTFFSFALRVLQKYEFIMYGFSLVWLLLLILFRAILLADDCIMYRQIDSSKDSEDFQKDIDRLDA